MELKSTEISLGFSFILKQSTSLKAGNDFHPQTQDIS